MILETARLILRPFDKEDVESSGRVDGEPGFYALFARCFFPRANGGFLKTILGWNRAGLPSQFAVILRENSKLIGYCVSFINK